MNKEVKTKKITIDTLAIMMVKSFESLGKNISEIKEEVNEIKEDVKIVKKDVEGFKNQLEGVNKRIDDYAETKVSKIEHKKLITRVEFIENKLEIKI